MNRSSRLRKNAVPVLFLIPLMAILGCNKGNPADTETGPPSVIGTVTDAKGAPVESVAVHFISHTVPVHAGSSLAKVASKVLIEFDVPARCLVTIILYRMGTGELIDTLTNDTLGSGINTVQYDASFLTNGAYPYKIYFNHVFSSEQHLLLITTDLEQLAMTQPVVRTDKEGRFTLPNSVFGIGLQVVNVVSPTQKDTLQVTNVVDLVAYRAGYQFLTARIAVDPAVFLKKSFTLLK